MNKHRHRNKSSPEHRDSARNILEKIDKKNRDKKLLSGRLQLLAGFGRPPDRVISAFRKGTAAETKAFKTDGKKLLFNGHEVARKERGGIAVSFAGFDTAMTAATIRALGVDTRRVKGVTSINGKTVNPETSDFTFVPATSISSGTFRISDPTKVKKVNETNRGMIDDQEKFRKNVRQEFTGSPTKVPEDPTVIQPRDQKQINSITGVKSEIPRATKGPNTHHLLFKDKVPGMRTNRLNGIPLSNDRHQELHKHNPPTNFKKIPTRISKLQARLASINPLIRKKVTGTIKKKISVKKGMVQTAKMLSADALVNALQKSGIDFKGVNGVYDPVQNRILDATIPSDKSRIQELFESGDNNVGFNSITDTRQGPNTDFERLRTELKDIESRGGTPSIGFDNGSLEANDTVIGDTDTIMSKLLNTQNSTGIVSPTEEFRVVDNPRFIK